MKAKKYAKLLMVLLLLGSFAVNLAVVTPAYAASISLSFASGPVGSVVNVTGSGFSVNETGINITFDGTTITSGIIANASGTWAGSFTVPTASYGNHTVGAYGAVTTAASVPVISFFVLNPNITASQTTGPNGTLVAITGTGFAPNETGITVTFDSNAVVFGIVANSLGNWSASFNIPATTSGFHTISAYGSITQAGFVPTLTFMVVNPAIVLSQITGTPGSVVTVTGTGFAGNESGITITFDGSSVTVLLTATAQGTWSGTFTVPNAPGGPHAIGAYGFTTPVSSVAPVTFTVTPNITSTQTSGPPGTALTINGFGFGSNETGITVTFDSNSAATGITANAQGTWKASFNAPPSPSGTHIITAYGSVTRVTSVTSINFMIGPAIVISVSSGAAGTPLTVTGAGFIANEKNINITYDGDSVASGITADAQGSWKGSFTVPSSTAGSHIIGAYGASTLAGVVTAATFTLNPTIAISLTTGTPGTTINVTGSGFGSNETGITITYDGAAVDSGITANAVGNWAGSFTVPPSAAGTHKIQAYGLLTQTTQVAGTSFKINPAITLNPTNGYVSKPLAVNGQGFAANSAITISYDDQVISAAALTSDATGSFSTSFTVPVSLHGGHTITVTDSQKNTMKAAFNVDSTPPPVPTPLSPTDGARVGFTKGGTPTFTWSAVTDPSGVTYTFQVDTSPDFPSPLINKSGLAANRYTLSAGEALPYGKFYWRVMAIDGASNQSAWSDAMLLKAGLLMTWVLIVIIVLVILAIGAGAYFLLRRFRKKPEEEKPVVVTGVETAPPPPPTLPGEWRVIEPGPSTEQPGKQLPWRLALPEEDKKTKAVSTEDQARLKLTIDFAQSLPLVQPEYNTDWIIDMVEAQQEVQMSAEIYEKLFNGEIPVSYSPTWLRHPAYQDLTALLEKQAILQDLNSFVSDADRCVTDAVSLLQQIYREAKTDLPADFLERGGWWFITAIYTDAVNWFAGKSLREPSDRDYTVKPASWAGADPNEKWLSGEESNSFAGELILVKDDAEASRLRGVHIRMRRAWRNNEKARQIAATVTQLQLQRARLLSTFSQFDKLKM